MHFAFDAKYAPLMDCMGFVETDIDTAFKMYSDWSFPQLEKTNKKANVVSLNLSFPKLIGDIVPLKYPEKRLLFSTNSDWVGYLENATRTETGRIRRISEPLNCRSVEVAAWPNKFGKTVNGWGGGFFTLNQGDIMIRHLMLSDQDKWEFDQYGEPLPFEETERYKEKFARNRFTPEMLDRYLKEFGIEFFNDDFYMPKGSKAYIIEIVRPPYEGEEPKTLEELRKELGYE